ncbi:hypothetical protein [Nocardia sp. CA-120079]|uniref:hypothetical protein n=1 Tax=Nocardia sp. CA-120079 TaxID=3239974 RepID=UPI003D98BD0E
MPASVVADSTCSQCADPLPPGNLTTTLDGECLCVSCVEDLSVCVECGGHTRSPHLTSDDTLLCARCMSGWERCDDCHTYSRATTTAVGAREICGNCVSDYQTCDDCARLCTDTYGVQGGNRVCDTCLDEDYRECAECFDLIPYHDTYCQDCTRPGHPAIHGYDYKPPPHFHGTGPLFLGLELEIKTPTDHFNDAVDTALAHIGDLAYLKEDSSISPCGFELVTHPMSYEYAQTQFPWGLLARLRLLGCYTDSDVGIHVHVSREGFDSSAHVYRWLKFVYRNQTPVTILARRSSSWAEFSPHARSNVLAFAKGERSAARYHAINVRPEHTFELRIFASSLQPRQVQAAVAFAAASVEYTRSLTAADIARRRGWEWNAFTTWLRGRPQYSPLLAELEDLACAS